MKPKAHGFTMVELMVAAALALITTVVLFQTLTLNERYKRNTSGANDAQQSGVFAAAFLEQALRGAGAGFIGAPGVLGCKLSVRRGGTTLVPRSGGLPAPFNNIPDDLRVFPVFAVDGGNGPDSLVVMRADTSAGSATYRMQGADPTPSAISLNTSLGIRSNDLLLLSAHPNDDANSAPAECDLTQERNSGGTADRLNLPLQISGAVFSRPSFTGNYAAGLGAPAPWLTTLGRAPYFHAFSVQQTAPNAPGNLMDLNLLPATAAAEAANTIAGNVVDMQVLYGVDRVDPATSTTLPFGDGNVDDWVSPTGPWAANTLLDGSNANSFVAPRLIRAVRVALLISSSQPERVPSATRNNDVVLFPDRPAAQRVVHTIGAGGLDPTFRYRVFDMTLTLPNAGFAFYPFPP